MNLLDGLVELVLGMRGLKTGQATLLADMRHLMEDFDKLAAKVTVLGERIDTLTTATGETKTALVDIRGDVNKLRDIIAGAGPGGLNVQQTEALDALITTVDQKAAAAVEALAAVSADAQAVSNIVT